MEQKEFKETTNANRNRSNHRKLLIFMQFEFAEMMALDFQPLSIVSGVRFV